MRSRAFLLTSAALAGVFLIPAVAAAQGMSFPFFGPIIPAGIRSTCPASFAAFIDVVNRIISLLITLTILFVAPLMIAYAGFKYVINPISPSGRQEANKMLLHLVTGIAISLSAWLIVNAVFAVLTPGGPFKENWATIVNGTGDLCLKQAGSLRQVQPVSSPTVTTGGVTIGVAQAPCEAGNTACSPSAIQTAANALQLPLTNDQITAMSCIAMTESRGNPWTPDSKTGACGTFQITTRPGNWSIASFHQSPCSTSSSCNDPACNLQTALLLYGKRGYQPWTGKNPDGSYWNANAVACVQKYNPGATNI